MSTTKELFWNLELEDHDDANKVFKILSEFFEAQDYGEDSIDDIVNLTEIQMHKHSFTKDQLSQLYPSIIKITHSGRQRFISLDYCCRLLSLGQQTNQEHIITALEILQRFGIKRSQAWDQYLQNCQSQQAIDLKQQDSFLSSRAQLKKPSNEESFWTVAISALLSRSIDPLTEYLKRQNDYIENKVIHWLIYRLIVSEKRPKKIASPKTLLRQSYGSKVNKNDKDFLHLAVALENALASSELKNLEIEDIINDASTAPNRFSEILIVALLVKKADETNHPSLASLVATYKNLQAAFCLNKNADIFNVLPIDSTPKISEFKSSQMRRTYRILKFGGKNISSRLIAKINTHIFDTQKVNYQLQEEFRTNLAALGVEVRDLRGGFAKLFQLGAAIEGFFPKELQTHMLGTLDRCSAMSQSEVDKIFLSSKGAKPEDIFNQWEPLPFACGSIGQVHHATLPSGESVCVKVRYPGIEKAVKNDFESVKLVALLFR